MINELVKKLEIEPPDFNCFFKKFEELFSAHSDFDKRLCFIKRACNTLNHFKSASKTSFFIEHFCDKFNLPPGIFYEYINKIETEEKKFESVRIDAAGIAIFNRDWHYISNFSITPQFQIIDDNEDVQWIIKIQRGEGKPEFIKISNDDWCSARRLQKMLIKKQYVLKCTDCELRIFQEHIGLIDKANKVTELGYNALSNSYFFANAVVNSNKILLPDEFGIVTINEKSFYMPYLFSKPFKNTKRFIHTNNNISFNSWSKLFIAAHKEHAFIPLIFYISSLFRDYSYKEKRIVPLLYIKGIRGTGKSSIARNLTACFGFIQDELSLKSPNTAKSLPRILAQSSDSLLWLDEYHNGLDSDITGVIQSVYDGGGYEMAANTNGIETKSITILSSVILTSNYLPEDNIFSSRTVLTIMNDNKKTLTQRTAYNELLMEEKKGLSSVTIDLFQYRTLVINDYLREFDFLFNFLSKSLAGLKIENRMIENMCVVLTPAYILLKNKKISFNDDPDFHEKLLILAKQNIINQNSILFSESDIFQFWSIFHYGVEIGRIKKGVDYKFRDANDEYGEPDKDSTIVIRFARIYKFYQEELKQKAKLQNELIESLRQDDSYCSKIDSFRFTTGDDERKNEQDHFRTTIGYQFNFPALCEKFGLNL